MPSRKKPGVAFWATVALVVVLVAYPLSFVPACWISKTNELPLNDGRCPRAAPRFYRPIGWAMVHGPDLL
jgi:hypothetical protein